MWQIAEEQLLQLLADTSEPETHEEPGRRDAEAPQLLQESDLAPTGVLVWRKRLWGGSPQNLRDDSPGVSRLEDAHRE